MRKILSLFSLVFVVVLSEIADSESVVKAAVVHFCPDYAQVDINRERIISLAEEAGSRGAKIVIFPHLATSG